MTGEVGPEVNQRLLVGRRAPESVLATVSTVGASGRLVHDGDQPEMIGHRPGDLPIDHGEEPGAVSRVPGIVETETDHVLAQDAARLLIVGGVDVDQADVRPAAGQRRLVVEILTPQHHVLASVDELAVADSQIRRIRDRTGQVCGRRNRGGLRGAGRRQQRGQQACKQGDLGVTQSRLQQPVHRTTPEPVNPARATAHGRSSQAGTMLSRGGAGEPIAEWRARCFG